MEQPRINLAEHGKPIVCESCSGKKFREIVYLYKIPRLITGALTDTIVPMPSFECALCNHVNKEFQPAPTQQQ